MSPIRSVAIVGAGPAGLTLGRLLHNKGIDFTIFESEGSPTVRSQGGTLDLHPGSGQEAIKQAGLWDQFEKNARYDGEAFTICDDQLNISASHAPTEAGEKPEIDRSVLRNILLESIPKERIQWGKKLIEYADDKLHFEDGTSFQADLVVGADGGWSHLRPHLSDVKPLWTGASYFSFRLNNPSQELYELVNRGSVFAISYGQCLSIQYMGDESLQIYTFFQPENEEWIKQHGTDKQALETWYKSWNPLLRSAYEAAELTFSRNLYMLPVGFQWTHKPGLTLIGDAAHLFTPFAGEGVNCGMTDAMELANAIEHDNIATYEEKKFKRTRQVQLLTWQNTIDTLTNAHLRVFGERLGSRLISGTPDETTHLDQSLLNRSMLHIAETNS